MTDSLLSLLLIIVLCGHFVGLILGYKRRKTTLTLAYVNAIFVVLSFVFWAITSWNNNLYNIAIYEGLLICFEACILSFALYSIKGFEDKTYVKIINSIGFGIHVLAIMAMLYYIRLFKFDQLF
ncbi:hypothetical protein [Winogradskyella rapida]|uniref:Uncharacterized protein n=1 Tax=Winogradskyella rapida TaxID=549701 RepID=A0ABW3KQU9_9FLAO